MWRCSRPVPVALRRLSGRSAELRAWRWGSTTACERALQYRVGEKMHGYTVSQVTPVPELFLTAVKLDHDGTGARHLHLAREDSNNLFSVQFRTTPMDSTGVPHILEHTVLCGSQKYPCRDPFFKMLNRSLSTFMNAFTASDYTMYPFSTQNPKDFQNLLSVYLDAAFFPCLRELDFWQEGWRLEHEDPTDPKTALVFKGVVFNEMKGAFADSERVFSQHLQNQLLPDHTYAAVSGGAPLCIPDLTWEQLREFHAKHYHPRFERREARTAGAPSSATAGSSLSTRTGTRAQPKRCRPSRRPRTGPRPGGSHSRTSTRPSSPCSPWWTHPWRPRTKAWTTSSTASRTRWGRRSGSSSLLCTAGCSSTWPTGT
uniref:Pitrilysin metallopeptidase 1 n=1 Tax=Rousettus aegyptiacus TaxID=9407 RepID=A0A7J8E9B6_ROUAE|nr:pitrilysin metallopeptidase 1 [Rousettus aegyptiacus]